MINASFITFALAAFAIIIVPGPSVTVIIANALRKGTVAGLMNVAGTQAGLVPMVLIVAFGLETIVGAMGHAFFWIKLAGAAYLVWLGFKLLASDGSLSQTRAKEMDLWEYFWQGFIVVWSNPKALFFFGAFIPQFVDTNAGNTFFQTVLLGGTFIAIATVCDSMYAILAGKAGNLLTQARVRVVEICSGTCLIGGGLWLAIQRQS